MRQRIWLLALALSFFSWSMSMAQEAEALRSDYLEKDFKSLELISPLANPAPLTIPVIRQILDVPDEGLDREIGFGAVQFSVAKENGYTRLSVEGVAITGSMGIYRIELKADKEIWPEIRDEVIDLWKGNGGPEFVETDTGIIHTEKNEAVLSSHRSAVSAVLGELKPVDVPAALKRSFNYLMSPEECTSVGAKEGEIAVYKLVKAERIDLLENVLRGVSPGGRVYAARALLRLSKSRQLVLSSDTASVIEKVRNLDILILRVTNCIIAYRTAKDILEELNYEREEQTGNTLQP